MPSLIPLQAIFMSQIHFLGTLQLTIENVVFVEIILSPRSVCCFYWPDDGGLCMILIQNCALNVQHELKFTPDKQLEQHNKQKSTSFWTSSNSSPNVFEHRSCSCFTDHRTATTEDSKLSCTANFRKLKTLKPQSGSNGSNHIGAAVSDTIDWSSFRHRMTINASVMECMIWKERCILQSKITVNKKPGHEI